MEDCMHWIRKDGKKGRSWYGSTSYKGRRMGMHKYTWIINNGEVPSGMYVCHKCDNPFCINIKHLFLGTHLENMQDKMRKGRHRFVSPLKTVNGMRPCFKCKKVKSLNEYSPSGISKRTGQKLYHHECKPCRAEKRRDWVAERH